MMKKTFFVAMVAAVAVFYFFYSHISTKGPLGEDAYVLVPRGSGSRVVAMTLAEAGVIKNPYVFMILGRINGLDKRLKAGEYYVSAGSSMLDVMKTMARGDVFYRRITFPEGITTKQFLDIVQNNEFLSGEITLKPVEGDLLPETYSFERETPRNEVIRQAMDAMEKVKTEAWENREDDLPLKNINQMMVLASIVEKETGVPEERGLVASVFVNRLLKGMKLQTDPTVIYALTKGQYELGRQLSRKDLQIDDAYNTYFYYGLPPTPICNPSKASIQAVVNPDVTPYLYFVATGSGGHNFSTNLNDHNTHVKNWKKSRKTQ